MSRYDEEIQQQSLVHNSMLSQKLQDLEEQFRQNNTRLMRLEERFREENVKAVVKELDSFYKNKRGS